MSWPRKRPIPPLPQINRPFRKGQQEPSRLWDQLEEVVAAHGAKLRSHHKAHKERTPEVTRLFKRLQGPQLQHQAPQSRVLVEACRCLRCGHVWVTKLPPPAIPRQCAGCKSFRWFYPEEFSKSFWLRWKLHRKELHAKEEEWAERLSREGLKLLRDQSLKRLAEEARQRARGTRSRERGDGSWVGPTGGRRNRPDQRAEGVAPSLGCACVPGHLQGATGHPGCDDWRCPCHQAELARQEETSEEESE